MLISLIYYKGNLVDVQKEFLRLRMTVEAPCSLHTTNPFDLFGNYQDNSILKDKDGEYRVHPQPTVWLLLFLHVILYVLSIQNHRNSLKERDYKYPPSLKKLFLATEDKIKHFIKLRAKHATNLICFLLKKAL